MFVEFTLFNDEKISFNINHIKTICKDEGKTIIYCAFISKPFDIKESYDEVMEAINKHSNNANLDGYIEGFEDAKQLYS